MTKNQNKSRSWTCFLGILSLEGNDREIWWCLLCKQAAKYRNRAGIGPMLSLVRYVKKRVAHAPGIPETFFPLLWVSDPDMHQGTCVTHVPWRMPGSLFSGFRWRPRASQNFTCLVRGPCCQHAVSHRMELGVFGQLGSFPEVGRCRVGLVGHWILELWTRYIPGRYFNKIKLEDS